MKDTTKQPLVIERFYQSLDETTEAQLTAEQKKAVENAVIAITLASHHRVDIRKSFPFLRKRYYLVFLLGRDMRRYARKESTLFRVLMTGLVTFGILFCIASLLLGLYMIKSALGIDLFEHFHLGLWDWYLHYRGQS